MPAAARKPFRNHHVSRGIKRALYPPILIAAASIISFAAFLFTDMNKESVFASPTTEEIWGIAQECSFNLTEAGSSLDLAFNDLTAECTGIYTNGSQYWVYTGFQDTTILTITQVILDVRFYFSGWENDTTLLQISNNNGDVWTTLETFGEINPPPGALETRMYDVGSLFLTPDEVNAAQVRFRGEQEVRGVDVFSIYLDEARLAISGETYIALDSPMVQNTPTAISTETPTSTPTATPVEELTNTPTPSPNASPTHTQIMGVPGSPTPTEVAIDVLEMSLVISEANTSTGLWGTTQSCTNCTITDPGNSIDLALNDLTASTNSTFGNGRAWTYTAFDEFRLNVSDNYPPLPTPTSPAPEPTSTPIAANPHVYYTAATDSCAACHRSHTAVGIVLRKSWGEEALCFNCHADGGTGKNVQPAFTSYTNTATRYFKHNISSTSGVHRLDQNIGASYGGSNRHVECEDCHEPHEATRGSTNPPIIQRVMTGMSGVDPVWTGSGSPAVYNWLNQAGREYQVCFKCHSGFTTLPTYQPDGWDGNAFLANGLRKLTSTATAQVPDSRDLASEFNPYNASFHPVVALGRNQNMPAGGFVSGWLQTSMVYCSDCHTNATPASGDVGPHGSPRLHILVGANNYATISNNIQPNSGEVCFKCHSYVTYVNNGTASNTLFRDGDKNLHDKHTRGERAPCYICHDSHGSEQLHLINFDVSAVTIGVNRNSQNAWEIVGNTRTCYLSCHGKSHSSSESYTP